MKKDLKQLGNILKEKRTEMNISLKEAENATSIRTEHLHAIEQGEISRLISPVYAQGFFKQYALFLGLDGDKLVKENIEIFSKPDKQDFAYGIGTMETRGTPGGSVKLVPNAIWGIAFLLLMIGAWYAAKFLEVL